MSNEHSELPGWADRIRRERDVRGWSPADAVAALRTFSDVPLPGELIDQWTRWECGRSKPDEFYRPLIAATFGTVVESIFPGGRPSLRSEANDEGLLSRCGIDTHELVQRIGRYSVDATTLAALELTIEQLCCEYSGHDATQLIAKSREWLSRITRLLDERLTLVQRKHLLDAAGWLTLLSN